jgi:hypothetical protein
MICHIPAPVRFEKLDAGSLEDKRISEYVDLAAVSSHGHYVRVFDKHQSVGSRAGLAFRDQLFLNLKRLRIADTPQVDYSKGPQENIRPSYTSRLDVDRKSVNVIEGLADSFVDSRMGVDRVHHGFHCCLRFHSRHRLGNQLESFWPDDVDT